MKLQNFILIFLIVIIPVILLVSLNIDVGLETVKYQTFYDNGLLAATHDAILAFETNMQNDEYSGNPERKREILKASVKMFEKSLVNTCGISAYNINEIEEYIPAIVFGMYDGFYMYAPTYNSKTDKYEHDLKNYVYYSEKLDDGTIIRYSLDNYVVVSGKLGNSNEYLIKDGYLLDLSDTNKNGTKYKGIDIDTNDEDAVKYYKDAYYFTDWFLNTAEIPKKKKNLQECTYLNISDSNDPEDEDSDFVKHKREVIRAKLESVLNSTITAYSKRTFGKTYKMPKLSEEDWAKIYSNISMITFFQGKKIGLTKYNGYAVLNSTNSNEYVNPNLMYFVDEDESIDEDKRYYHDIRCSEYSNASNLKGYRIGDFQKIKLQMILDEHGNPKKNPAGKILYQYKDENGLMNETTSQYWFKHQELTCYKCINGQLSNKTAIYEYIKTADVKIKTAYWTSLARERYNTEKVIDTQCVVTYKLDGLNPEPGRDIAEYGEPFTTRINPENSSVTRPDSVTVKMNGEELSGGYKYDKTTGEITIYEVRGDIIIIASSRERTEFNVNYSLNNLLKAEENKNTATKGQIFETHIYPINDRVIKPETIEVKMGGIKLIRGNDYLYTQSDGKITIFNVNGDIEITAEGESYTDGKLDNPDAGTTVEGNRESVIKYSDWFWAYELKVIKIKFTEDGKYHIHLDSGVALADRFTMWLYEISNIEEKDKLNKIIDSYSKQENNPSVFTGYINTATNNKNKVDMTQDNISKDKEYYLIIRNNENRPTGVINIVIKKQ